MSNKVDVRAQKVINKCRAICKFLCSCSSRRQSALNLLVSYVAALLCSLTDLLTKWHHDSTDSLAICVLSKAHTYTHTLDSVAWFNSFGVSWISCRFYQSIKSQLKFYIFKFVHQTIFETFSQCKKFGNRVNACYFDWG